LYLINSEKSKNLFTLVLPTRWLYGYVSLINVDVFARAVAFPGFWLSLGE